LSKISLAVEVAGLRLRSPLMNAAGVLGMSPPILKRVYDSGAGAVVTKSVGPVPRTGHPNPTLVRVSCGALNAMGLPNPGAGYFVDEIKALKEMGVPVVASFFGGSIEEFAEVAGTLSEAGADAITAVNTLKGMAIDIDFRRPVLTNVTGGLSGPAVKPVALRCVWEVAEAVDVPVIGCGGVTTWRDAVEYFLAGASALEMGTAVMTHGFEVYGKVNEGIRRYLEENGFSGVKEVVGLAHQTGEQQGSRADRCSIRV